MKLSRKVEYGLMALNELAQSQARAELVSAKALSETLGISFEVIAKVLQSLSSQNLVKVKNGAAGGYELLKSLEQISLLEVIEAVEGAPSVAKCLTDSHTCDIQDQCQISEPMANLNLQLLQFYRQLTLNQLFRRGPQKLAEVLNG